MSNDIYNIVKEDFSAKALGSETTESCYNWELFYN
jgi:hypothetical protein